MLTILIALLMTLATQVSAHSGGLNKPYHCHRAQQAAPKSTINTKILTGTITNVRDGDTIVVDGVAIRLAALDCPERGSQKGDYATELAQQFYGLIATCELTGAKTYDRLVGYCEINGADFGSYMIQNSSCKVWEKYDVCNRY